MARQEPFRVLAQTIPYDKNLPIRILDVGAGYGALTQFLLGYFPNATAVLQDGSEEMAKIGQERMARFKGRFDYVFCDFCKPGWTQKLTGTFEAVVSAIAIHNAGSPKIIERIYHDIFPSGQKWRLLHQFRPRAAPIGRPDEMAKGRRFSKRATLLDR